VRAKKNGPAQTRLCETKEHKQEISALTETHRTPTAPLFREQSMRLSLTESQFLHIANAAQALAPADQSVFYEKVADALRDVPIGDGSVGRAIKIAQLQFPHPVTAPPHSRRQE
jgi:hypothetical protein